jgi:hypothetical protein
MDSRNQLLNRHSKTGHLPTSSRNGLGRAARRKHSRTGVLDKPLQFAGFDTRRHPESLEQQRTMVGWLMALLWILFFIAVLILWNKASSGS